MIHDTELLDKIADLPIENFSGVVFRATRKNLDPLISSSYGGRWGPYGGPNILYTSLAREGALAEVSFHWAQQTPIPSKPLMLHTLRVGAPKTLKLVRANFSDLGVNPAEYSFPNLPGTQAIGAAAEFLGYDGLIAPCARWECDNLILFPESASFRGEIEVIESSEFAWLDWAQENGFLGSA